LNRGADDYITKPFDRRELVARIRTKLRSKESEDRIRQRLEAVLQCTADAVLLFDAKACLSLVNPAGRKLLGEDAAKLGEQLPSHAGYDVLLQLLDQAQLSKGPISYEVLWPDERIFSIIVTPLAEGGFVVGLHDITYVKGSTAAMSNDYPDPADTQPELPANSN
jgi:nitrogen fixation/metabolism regulation signal transduction histidine kinase